MEIDTKTYGVQVTRLIRESTGPKHKRRHKAIATFMYGEDEVKVVKGSWRKAKPKLTRFLRNATRLVKLPKSMLAPGEPAVVSTRTERWLLRLKNQT